MNSQNTLYTCGKVLTNQQKKQWLYEDCMRNAEAFVNKTGPFKEIPDEIYKIREISTQDLKKTKKDRLQLKEYTEK